MKDFEFWLTILVNFTALLTIVVKLTSFINKIDTRFHQFTLETDEKIDSKISEHSANSNHEKISLRLNRIERRLSNTELKIFGDTDTFSRS